MLGQEGNVAVEHLKSVQVGPEHSAAYTASQLRSLCNASLDTNAGLHRGKVRLHDMTVVMAVPYVNTLNEFSSVMGKTHSLDVRLLDVEQPSVRELMHVMSTEASMVFLLHLPPR